MTTPPSLPPSLPFNKRPSPTPSTRKSSQHQISFLNITVLTNLKRIKEKIIGNDHFDFETNPPEQNHKEYQEQHG